MNGTENVRLSNGDSAMPKSSSQTVITKAESSGKQNPAAVSPNPAPNSSAEAKLSPAEQKQQKKAEKLARRERERNSKGAGAGSRATVDGLSVDRTQGSGGGGHESRRHAEQQRQKAHADPKPTKQALAHEGKAPHRATALDGATAMPLRRRLSQNANVKEQKKGVNEVALFGHLYGQQRRHSIENVLKEVHPAVVALGLQMSSYVICGSNARCVAMLLAFKSVSDMVIESYSTPPGISLARHLTSHHLSPQIDYLRSCRPLSISMGNAIRWLKDLIIKIDPDVPEATAKSHLLSSIDTFIRERITAADAVIAESASEKITSGDVIVTYAHSSIVAATLLAARAKGTSFRVIVVDSKPLFEGKRLTHKLAAAGIDVSYTPISGAAHSVRDATKVFLGAHAMLSNGRLYSRVGTAVVAMLAHERDVPVIVCCESVKFTDKVALDSIVGNEVAPPEELVGNVEDHCTRSLRASPEQQGNGGLVNSGQGDGGKLDLLQRWRDTPNLQILNILYDVTPAEFIKMVVTEYGSLPPSSVPVVHRLSTNG